ncbi:MAG: hypothetical protein IKU08_09755 [Clostridia bacterium]|nr:hypothetical protein [Clostridia bacterium]
MKKSVLSALVAAGLILAMLFTAGCGTEKSVIENETTTDTAITENTDVMVDITEEASPSLIHLPNQEATVSESETATESAAPQTIPEIVELFNKSANRIKPEASKVVKNYERRIVDKENLVVPKALESTAEGLMDTFMKDDTDPIVYATREEITNEYIVPNQSYVSKLTADAVAEATCTDKGDTYEIYIRLKNEKNPTAGKGVGAVCDVIEAHEVSEKVSFIEDFSTDYKNCTVRVTVDKASGRVTHAVYRTPLILNVTVNLFGTHKASVGLTFEKDYSITY